MGIPDPFTCLLRNMYAGYEAVVELDMKQQTGSKLGKEYVKAIYCPPDYSTYMQSESESISCSVVLTLCDPMDCSLLGSSVMEFSRQEYWIG